MLWRASRRLTAWTPVLGMLRLAVVAMVLVLAALAGTILAAAAGWASGYAPLVVCFLALRDDRAAAAPAPTRSD
jgi:hypothetical protein